MGEIQDVPTAREAKHIGILKALSGLRRKTELLEEVLNKIKGELGNDERKTAGEQPAPSLADFLNTTEGKIMDISQRIEVVINMLREELF